MKTRCIIVALVSLILSCFIGLLSIGVFAGYEAIRVKKGLEKTILNDEFAWASVASIAGMGILLWWYTTFMY